MRRALAVVVVAAVATGGLGFRFRGETEDWRAATASVLAGARPGDLMASADDYHLLVVAYYEAHLEREGTGPTPDLVLPTMPIADFHLEDWSYAEITEDGFACAVGGATRLWVFDGAEYFDLERRAQLRTFAAASFGPPSQERRFPGHADIAVRLYEVDDPRPVPPGCGS